MGGLRRPTRFAWAAWGWAGRGRARCKLLAACEPSVCVPAPIFWDLGGEMGEVGPESRGWRAANLPVVCQPPSSGTWAARWGRLVRNHVVGGAEVVSAGTWAARWGRLVHKRRPCNCHPVEISTQGPACPLALQHLTQRIRHGDVGERRPARTSVPRVGSAPLHSMTALSDTPRAVTTVGSGRPSRIAVLLLQWERTKDRRSFVSSGIIPAQVNLLGA